MTGLKFDWETIPVNQLRLEQDSDESVAPGLRYDHSRYALQSMDSLSSEAVMSLIQLHPIFAIPRHRKMIVVGGKRIFHLASFGLPPDQEVTVAVLDKKTSKDQLQLLKYIDISISSLLFRQNVSAAEIYQNINIPDLRKKAWLPPVDTTMQAFANILCLSTAALCTTSRKQELLKREIGQVSNTLSKHD